MKYWTAPGWRTTAIAATVAALALSSPLAAQRASAKTPGAAASSATPVPPDSTTPPKHSRFGRFGRMFEKAASRASDVGARAGISKGTAARLAVTVATGGAAAALMEARVQGATSAATLATRGLTSGASSRSAPPTAPSNALTQQAVQAMSDLGQISLRAQQHDPAAVRAMQALSTAMSKPNGEFVALQHRASSGDPTAAQEIVIREDVIARAALDGRAP